MPDRDKVIKALEICEKKDCVLCPYTEWCGEYDDSYFYDCTKLLAKDALALLKEQEAATIKKTKEHGFGVYGGICPKCNNWIQSAHSFCGFCGQAVKWNA